MDIGELHTKLTNAYAADNLNKIAVTLIRLHREQQFDTLKQIAGMVNESSNTDVRGDPKDFSKLMMLYHPDRGHYHRAEINRLAAEGNYDGLLEYSHILMLERIEEIAVTMCSLEDIDYSPVYEWDFDIDEFQIIDSNQDPRKEKRVKREGGGEHLTFYDAFQRRMYGNVSKAFPLYYFEDIEEFELAHSGINDLQGIQYCVHARSVDLSGNSISDISHLWGLTMLEELNLADNNLSVIDTLSNLQNLRNIILSDNPIEDVTPLMSLNRLEYLEISGHRISQSQIKELEESGVTVVRDI